MMRMTIRLFLSLRFFMEVNSIKDFLCFYFTVYMESSYRMCARLWNIANLEWCPWMWLCSAENILPFAKQHDRSEKMMTLLWFSLQCACIAQAITLIIYLCSIANCKYIQIHHSHLVLFISVYVVPPPTTWEF